MKQPKSQFQPLMVYTDPEKLVLTNRKKDIDGKLPVKKGDILPVSVKLVYEGTLRSYVISVEGQPMPTVQDGAKNHPIVFDGNPILIHAIFYGVAGTTIKKLDFTINGKTGYSLPETSMKSEGMELKVPVNYAKFNLIPI